jgi:hypothetical protein
MICNATRHRRGPFKPLVASDQSWQSQAFVLRAEVVDATDKVHSRLQGLALSRQRSRASGQAVQTSAEGPVKPLNEGGVNVPFALRPLDHLRDRFFCSLINLPCHANDAMAFIMLDHLRDQNVGPFDEATSSYFLARLFLAKDILDDGRITRQAIGAKENRPAQGRGAAFDARDEIFDQGAVPMLTDFSAQPQTGRDHHRHPHPDDCALKLDPKLIGLDLAQSPRLLDQMLMHGLRMPAAFFKPVPDRSLIQTKGEDDRLDRATVREQFHHQRQEIRALPQTVKDRPGSGAESHLALAANVTTVFLGMDTNIAFSNLSSGGTVEVGTKCGFWGQWRFLFLTRHKENRRLTSDLFQRAIRPRLNVGLPLRWLLQEFLDYLSRGELTPKVGRFLVDQTNRVNGPATEFAKKWRAIYDGLDRKPTN